VDVPSDSATIWTLRPFVNYDATMPSTDTRRPRADAQRNRDALIASAARLVQDQGSATTFEDIARDAGVGKGTLYRHFPTRDHLIAAIMQARFDELAARAEQLRGADDPRAAVDTWLREYDRHPIRSRGLGASVGEGLANDNSAISTACQPMKQSFCDLVERAQEAGTIRADVNVPELLTVVASFPEAFRNAEGSSPFLETVLRGLRT
jgi:AcrR family transcriptional regulator